MHNLNYDDSMVAITIENNHFIELNLIENTKAKKTKSQRACPRKRKKKKKPNININNIHIQTFDTHTTDDSDTNNTSSLKIHSPSRNWNDWYNTIIERSKVDEKSNNNTSIKK